MTLRTLIAILFAASLASAQDLAIVGATIIDGNGGGTNYRRNCSGDGAAHQCGRPAHINSNTSRCDGDRGGRPLRCSGLHRYQRPPFPLWRKQGPLRDAGQVLWRENEIVLEAAQIQLQHGVTTVRDSYGMLEPLTLVRDAIARHEATGTRILAAGNIVGWGGPYSTTFSLTPQTISPRSRNK